MSEPTDDRVDSRAAGLLPEERTAGSDNPRAQAAEILRESDIRENDLDAAPDSFVEHRTSEQTVTPPHP
ncbi:hypothetical protein HC031_03565 [Planosporangium thailandense]|uniref:Uncharacterized protein n=1 Tax=Planosporangium thailandense TaxID=765197 RepID=A0ABX0XSP7_9ACTN|nr:hypothetical protein [Planosporangium thailandense]NJC68808.1 hypothetical protein [Planosporangium thailandense]